MYNEFFQRISYNFTSHLQNNLHLTEYNLCISNEPSLFQGLVCRCSNLMTVAVCSIAYRSCCMGFEPRTQRRVTKSSTFATDSFATREGKPTQNCNGNWKPSARCLEKFIKAMSLLIISYPQTLNDGQFGHIFTQQNALRSGDAPVAPPANAPAVAPLAAPTAKPDMGEVINDGGKKNLGQKFNGAELLSFSFNIFG